MKKMLLNFAALLLFFMSHIVSAETITIQFEWQPNTESDLAQYVLFHRVEDQQYDYTIPIKIIAAPATTVKASFEVPDNEVIDNYFVMRAEDTNENQSTDSNEVYAQIDARNSPIPSNFTGVYNDESETIDFTWDQIDANLVSRWKLYMSETTGGPYSQVGSDIINDGSAYRASWKVPTDGNYFFTIVSFRDKKDTLSTDGHSFTSIGASFSPNSNEVQANVKIHPAPNKTFKIKLRVYQ